MRVNAIQAGAAAGVCAVVAGTVFEVRPPDAYGICMSCHGRDLLNWTINMLAHTHLEVAPASLVFPALTTVGVLIGSLFAAQSNREFRWRNPDNPAKTFVYGVLVMNCALLAGGCSTRLLLRSAAGDAAGWAGFGAMAIGVILGTYWLRWRATR